MGVLRRSDWVTAGIGAVLFVWGMVVVMVLYETVGVGSGLPGSDSDTCTQLATVPRLTHQQQLWDDLDCQARMVFSTEEVATAVAGRFPHEKALTDPMGRRLADADANANAGDDVVVAVCVYVDGRSAGGPVMRMLQSLADTVEPGFEYRVYFVYDEGDQVYDLGGEVLVSDRALKGTSTTTDLQEWFSVSVTEVAATQGVTATLIPIRLANRLGKPGPGINVAVAAAYADGAEYLYRVHADSMMLTPWAGAMVAELRKSSPPNLGVVGPKCAQAPSATLMHDMTHRTHLDIFPTHHPVELEGVVAGEWIARVYGGLGSRHSRVVPSAKVARHTQGRRGVQQQSPRLPFLRRQLLKHVKDGAATILNYLKSHVDSPPTDPTLYDTTPDRAALTRRAKALYKNGVYDKNGKVLVHPEGLRHEEADHRQARVLKSWDDLPTPADGSHWDDAIEDFFVIHRLARARVSHCMSSGLC